jgi:hypothetical protein
MKEKKTRAIKKIIQMLQIFLTHFSFFLNIWKENDRFVISIDSFACMCGLIDVGLGKIDEID